MFGKMNLSKDSVMKILTVLIIATIFFITMSVLTDDHDMRKQISDHDGASEAALCNILSEIKGVGGVNVLVEYTEENTVCGVIVTAEGAGNPVVKNNIIKGVSALYSIPVSSVMVFEKNQEDIYEKED